MMNKRKTGVLALVLLGAALIFWSCQTLDFSNPNAPIVDDVTIQSLVTGIEAGMRVDLAIYLRVVGLLGREIYYFEPADPRYTGEILFGNPDPGGFLVNRPWAARYRTIANCRFLLDRNAGPGVDGFAQTMLAYQLLLNSNFTNGRIKLDFSGDLSASFTASSVEALDAIHDLLDDGYNNLQAAGDAFPFQLSEGFAGFDTPAQFARFNRALNARVMAYRGDYDHVLEDLAESFLDPAGAMNLGVYHIYGTGLGDQLNEIFENPEATFVKLMGHPNLKTDAEANDQRFASKFAVRPQATTFDNLTTDLGVIITSSSTDPLPIIRNEELLLLRAEANLALGNLPAAQSDINIVRAAAGLPAVNISDPAALLNQLIFERRYSLFMEGHRWVDARRWDRLGDLPVDRASDRVIAAMPTPTTEEP